jgi:hypothetical protein
MTEHPRFEPVQAPIATMYLRYHGGALVGFILGLADRYLERRKSWLERREVRPARACLGVRRARLRALLTAVGMGAAVMTLALASRPPVHPGGGPAPQQPSKVASCPT